MFDIWAFLLQTLTASGVAVLLLILKKMFKDKLPPKWQFFVWSILGAILLVPAGKGGRYTLIHWRFPLEFLKTKLGDFSYTKVLFPLPMLNHIPDSMIDWLFVFYLCGVIYHIFKYIKSYVNLRKIITMGQKPVEDLEKHILSLAEDNNTMLKQILIVEGVPTAFVVGIFYPTLVLPSQEIIDDKILLHELFHLKNRDTLWSVVICFFRCIHWCNPLLQYCADQALNDMEARCDQYVLESIEGEERREYGHILLAMTNEQYSNTPGCTAINNGGRNISNRIEAIARFKQYPGGMKLVSICVIILLFFSISFGTKASDMTLVMNMSVGTADLAFSKARSTICTTPAGAIDTYAKAVLLQSVEYRTMCTSTKDLPILHDEIEKKYNVNQEILWESGVNAWPNDGEGYFIYNLTEVEKDVYKGLLVIELNYGPDGLPNFQDKKYLDVQTIQIEKEYDRWIVTPMTDFKPVIVENHSQEWGCQELPGYIYSGEIEDFRVEIKMQTVHVVENKIAVGHDFFTGTSYYFDRTPKPHAEFSTVSESTHVRMIYLGTEEDPVSKYDVNYWSEEKNSGEIRPDFYPELTKNWEEMMIEGESWRNINIKTEQGTVLEISGGGGSMGPEDILDFPEYYETTIRVNQKPFGKIKLCLEGGEEK